MGELNLALLLTSCEFMTRATMVEATSPSVQKPARARQRWAYRIRNTMLPVAKEDVDSLRYLVRPSDEVLNELKEAAPSRVEIAHENEGMRLARTARNSFDEDEWVW